MLDACQKWRVASPKQYCVVIPVRKQKAPGLHICLADWWAVECRLEGCGTFDCCCSCVDDNINIKLSKECIVVAKDGICLVGKDQRAPLAHPIEGDARLSLSDWFWRAKNN